MVESVRIMEATEEDVLELAAITLDAMEIDIITRFMFGHQREEAIRKGTKFFATSLQKRFTSPTTRCHIIKAVDGQSGEIMGWCLVRWEDGKPVEPPKVTHDQPTFLMWYWQEQVRNWRKLTAEKKHVGMFKALLVPC